MQLKNYSPFKHLSYDIWAKIFAAFNHLMLLLGVLYFFELVGLAVGFILYLFIVTVGTSIGYHRYFTHKAFETTQAKENFLLFVGSIAGLGPILGWAGIHRKHHAFGDSDKDPHSPKKGFFRSWFHFFNPKIVENRFISDLIKNPIIKFQHKWYFELLTLYIVLGYILLGTWAIYFVSMPMVLMFHVTGFVNAFTHTFGQKIEGSKSDATNVPIMSLLTGGESYHANHHRNAKQAIFGKWDPAKIFLPILRGKPV